MSQKTNPLSLRLASKNQNFCSPWFTDFFFADNFRYELQVENYIKLLLKENLYSNAFFSAKSYYRKFNFLIAIQDTRALRKEKQILFNIKSFVSPNKNSSQKQVLQNINKNNKITEHKNLSFRENIMLSKIFDRNSDGCDISCTRSILKNTNHNCAQHQRKYSIRKKVINNFLRIKQSYNLQTLNSLEISLSFIENNRFLNETRNHDSVFFSRTQHTHHTSPNPAWQTNRSWERNRAYQINSSCRTNHLLETNPVFKINPGFKKNRGCETNLNLQEIISKKVRIPILSCLDKNNSKALNPTFFNSFKTLRKNEITFSTGISNIQPIRFVNYTQNLVSVLDLVALLLEKRVSFTRIKSKIVQDISKSKYIKGVRISCSGRLGGRSKKAQKAKTQSYQWGETCLHTFSAKVLFAKKSVITSFGKIGIKVWISFI